MPLAAGLIASLSAIAFVYGEPGQTTDASAPATQPNEFDALIAPLEGFDEAAAAAVAHELAGRRLRGEPLERVLAVLAQRPAGDPVVVEAVRALGGTVAPEVVAAILDTMTDQEASAATREAGVRTLIRLTGRSDLGTVDAWTNWWRGEGAGLTPRELRDRVGRWQTIRARRLAEAEVELANRLAGVYRRLYVLTPIESRSALLLELLASPLDELRILGYDLAEREALSSRPPNAALIEAATRGLRDDTAAVRSAAADFLYTVNAPGAAQEAERMLPDERDPDTVAGALRILTRQPRQGALPIILLRLDPASEPNFVVDTAIDATLEYHRAFGIDGEQAPPTRADDDNRNADDATDADRSARAYVLDVLIRLRDDGISANGVTLLAELAGPEAIVGLLRSDRLPVAQAAARALDDSPHTLDAKLAAARDNPGLFEQVVRSLIEHRPNAAGFAEAAALPASTSGMKQSLLLDYAAALPVDQLLIVAENEAELTRRAKLLERGVDADLWVALTDMAPNPGAPEAELLRTLTRTRLALKSPTGVATLLERAPDWLRDAEWAARRLVVSMVWLNQIEDALDAAESLPPATAIDAWLDGVRGASSLPHARSALAALRNTLGADMSADQRERAARLEQAFGNNTTRPTTPTDTDRGDDDNPNVDGDARDANELPRDEDATGNDDTR